MPVINSANTTGGCVECGAPLDTSVGSYLCEACRPQGSWSTSEAAQAADATARAHDTSCIEGLSHKWVKKEDGCQCLICDAIEPASEPRKPEQ